MKHAHLPLQEITQAKLGSVIFHFPLFHHVFIVLQLISIASFNGDWQQVTILF